jgi:hypothetical protein
MLVQRIAQMRGIETMDDTATGRRAVQTVLILYIALIGVGSILASVWAWRTAEKASVLKGAAVVQTSLLWWHFNVSVETSIYLIVIAFGVMGSVIHSANSLASYIGNKRFTNAWTPWYLLRPVIAAALAVLAYTVFRAGFLSTNASADNINLFGVAAIAGLAGLFSKQVIDKLEDVMKVVFASKADAERADKLQGLSIASISPDTTPAGTAVSVVITGTGFGAGAKVVVAGEEREPSSITPEMITVALTDADVATARTLELKVKSSSGETSEAVTFTVT